MSQFIGTVESALQPINEDLERLIVQHKQKLNEPEILRVLTLMAAIRDRALENGWDQQCEDDLCEAQIILRAASI